MQSFSRRLTLWVACVLVSAMTADAQTSVAGYNRFRERVYASYNDFRTRVLNHYAEFLNAEWVQSETTIERSEMLPKPLDLSESTRSAVSDQEMVMLPEVTLNTNALPGLSSIPKALSKLGKKFDILKHRNKSNYDLAVEKIPDPGFAFGPYPEQTNLPKPGEAWVEDAADKSQEEQSVDEQEFSPKVRGKFVFDFYGLTANIPDCDFKTNESMTDYGVQSGENYILLDKQEETLEASRQLFGMAQDMGLNGYLTYRLAEHYVKAKFPDANLMSQLSVVHYLMSQMGYDVRLALLTGNFPVIMMPFDQSIVYGLRRTISSGEDRVYSILPPLGYAAEDIDRITQKNSDITSAYIPVKNMGKTSDLRLTGLNIPMKAKPFQIQGRDITIKGEVNENLMGMLYRYPQMPMGDFASSWLDNELRKDILLQVKMQLAGLSEKDAVNKLMSLFHYGFEYATDQEYHGFEKPYFLEENLYYDKNDCEDRAMFFSYLVWNALDLPCQLMQYSNHESTAIAAKTPLSGAYYPKDGLKFFSADPTWKGSHWGELASPYDRESPKIDKVYE